MADVAPCLGRQRVNLDGAHVEKGFVLRVCVLSLRAHHEQVRMPLEDIREPAAELMP